MRLVAASLMAWCFAAIQSPLHGGEPSRAFLKALSEHEYHDVAIDYLNAMRTSPLADKAFQETIDFEIGVALEEGARKLPLKEREERMDEAAKSFQKFLDAHFQHPLADSANRHKANLLIDRGEIKTRNARQSGLTPAEKKDLFEEARKLFQNAQKALTDIDVVLLKKKKKYDNVDPRDTALIAERDQVWGDIMLTRAALAKMLYDIAQTYEPGSKESKDFLAQAAAKYDENYLKYSRWVGGYTFRIEEARCYKELGNYDKALDILSELTASKPSDEEGMRRIRSAATELAMQTALLPQVKKPKDAWDSFENWEKNIQQPEEPDSAEPGIKYLGGEAAVELARRLDENKPDEAKLRKAYLKRAKELLTFASESPGEFRLKAGLKLNDPLLTSGNVVIKEPQTYEEARDRAKTAWDQLGAADPNPEQVERLRAEALHCLRFALANVPRDAKIDETNTLRYCLAYLDWAAGEYYDAVVLGEFLARRYPDQPQAQSGALVALAAYANLLGKASSAADRAFENGRMIALAQYTAERWPNSAAADDAWITLIRAAAANRDSAMAMEHLGHISADSSRRGDAELVVGQALWSAYLADSRLPEGQQPTKTTMDKTISQAQKTLEDGVQRLRKAVDAGGEVSYALEVAVLALAQICLEQGQGDKAVAWLDDPKIGPNTLAKTNHKATDRGNFRVETFKAALRACVATQDLKKAEETMTALEKIGGTAKVAGIYVGLGQQLEASMKRLRAEGHPEEAAKASRGFELLLTRISTRPAKEITFNSILWVAETFVNLGMSLDSGNGPPSKEALEYYQKATEVYRKILELCRADEKFAPQPEAVSVIQIRLARCLRCLGKYDEALKRLVEILKARNALLDAQREAAFTYQAWGRLKPEHYLSAIRGGVEIKQKDGGVAYLIWGWGGIARRVQDTEAHQDTFDEARYNLALCRLSYALTKSGREKTDLLREAERDILLVQMLRPEMGGKKWYDQYDAMLRKIQKALGMKENEQGLKAAEKKLPAAKAPGGDSKAATTD